MLMSIVAVAGSFLRAQTEYTPDYGAEAAGGGIVAMLLGGVGSLIGLLIALVMIVSMWKIFEKAGKPGWASLVPIYNLIVMLEIVKKPIWWIALYLCCGPVGHIMVSLALAKVFGKDTTFGIMLIFIIGFPMLAFSDARYQPELAA
jgi:hypothetical protein